MKRNHRLAIYRKELDKILQQEFFGPVLTSNVWEIEIQKELAFFTLDIAGRIQQARSLREPLKADWINKDENLSSWNFSGIQNCDNSGVYSSGDIHLVYYLDNMCILVKTKKKIEMHNNGTSKQLAILDFTFNYIKKASLELKYA